MTAIAEILRQEILQRGTISFTRFMQLALYCPDFGYYERPGAITGRAADFYTSVAVGSLFGDLLAFQFAEWLRPLSPRPFQIVEAGAHDGSLAADILTGLGKNSAATLESLQYWIVEPSVRRQACQREKLDKFAGRVRWFDAFASLPQTGVHGVIFSNELLDAFPVRRLGWDASMRRWFEWGVDWQEKEFVWKRIPIDPGQLNDELLASGLHLPPELEAALPAGFILEICPAVGDWWRQAGGKLRAGKLLTFDYGLRAEQFLTPERTSGTLRAYHKHHASSDLLANPGDQDLTAHVNFSQLQRAGEAAGLRTEALISQEKLLIGIARSVWQHDSSFGERGSARLRQLQTLIHPAHLGQSFQVLIQSRPEVGPPSTPS